MANVSAIKHESFLEKKLLSCDIFLFLCHNFLLNILYILHLHLQYSLMCKYLVVFFFNGYVCHFI